MSTAKDSYRGRALARGSLGIGSGRPGLTALVAGACALGACALGACGGGGRGEVTTALHAGAPCPGGALTSAGARRLRAEDAGETPPGSRPPGCPYEAAVTIGRPGEGVFRQPEALAVGPSGRVYVADQFSHLVQMFSRSGVFEGQWGSGRSGTEEFGAVGGLAVDPYGDLYVVDSTHDRVGKYTAAGHLITSWGSPGSGVGQFNFGGGVGPDEPPGGGIAAGGSYVYVSDSRNNRIERFALDGRGAKVVVSAGSARGEVRGPQGLAVARASGTRLAGGEGGKGRHSASAAGETLYVADDGNDRVQAMSGDGRFLAQARSFDATPSTFQNPWDVAVHGGSVYVVDDNHGRVVRFDREMHFAGYFTGSGPYRLSDFLRAAATDRRGDVFVADSNADRVDVFTPEGALLRRWGSSVEVAGCCASRAGEMAPGQFVAPVDVVAGPGGRLLVAEAFREIVPLYPTGTPLSYRAAIAYASPWSTGGGVTLGSRFFSPAGLAFARDGTVWVTDRNNDVLRHLGPSGQFLAAVGVTAGARESTGTLLRLTEPHGVAVDPTGVVVVADTGADRIKRLTANGALLAAWSSPAGALPGASSPDAAARSFQRPLAVAAGAAGHTYVADTGSDRVEVLDPRGRLVASWGGSGSALGRFLSPSGIAVDASGDVYVADGILDRVQEFTADGKLLAAWGSAGTRPGELREPAGMSIDCRGDLLVADTGNNRVTIFTRVAPAVPCKT